MPRFVVPNPFENKEKPALIKDVVNHPLISGYSPGGIIRDFLQSQNYIQGSQGWRLRPDGVIEALGIQISGASTIAGWNVDATKIHTSNAHIHSSGYISFGATPPSFYGNNVGTWLGFSGGLARVSLYSDNNNYLQWDGNRLLIKAANFTLDSSGNLTASNVNLTGAITATSGSFTGTVNASSGSFTGAINATSGTLGDLTVSGTLTGGNITGAVIRTATSGARIELNNVGNTLDGFNASNTHVARLDASAGELVARDLIAGNIPTSLNQYALFQWINAGGGQLRITVANGTSSTSGITTFQQDGEIIHRDGLGRINCLDVRTDSLYMLGHLALNQNGSGILILNENSHWTYTGTKIKTGGWFGVIVGADLKGWIDSNGAYNQSSDARLKTNIETLTNGLDVVKRINPVQYDRIEDGKHETGFIAQEIEEIEELSHAVSSNPLDENGLGMKALDYRQITPYLLRAVQELAGEIEILKNMV